MIVLDTDHLSAIQYRDNPKAFALHTQLEAVPPHEVATTVISLEEQMRGWLRLIARYHDVNRQVQYYDRLIRMVDFFAEWRILPFDGRAADEFRRLRQQGVRIGTMDLKIAAIALANHARLLSGNLRDYQHVPGLDVADWLHG